MVSEYDSANMPIREPQTSLNVREEENIYRI